MLQSLQLRSTDSGKTDVKIMLNMSVKYFVKDYTMRNKRWCF